MGKKSYNSNNYGPYRDSEVHPADDLRETFLQDFKPRNSRQTEVLQSIINNQLNFLVGPAGTAKTFLSVTAAWIRLMEKKTNGIVFVRPAVEAADSVGYLPGRLEEKMYNFVKPSIEALKKFVDGDMIIKDLLDSKCLEFTSISFMRGITYEKVDVVCDEMQNATRKDLKTAITRIGPGCNMYITMDPEQCDLEDSSQSAINDLSLFHGAHGISMTQFGIQDVVRSGIVKKILDCYREGHR